MNEKESAAPLVAVVGPTASGKSALAVFLAGKLGGEVIACDSTQLYRRFNIGTAKPDETERRGIPHHLLDVYEPEQISTAGEYRRLALEVLEDLRRRKRLPILTVGTGLYLRALLEGLAETPLRSEELRKRLAADPRGKGPDICTVCSADWIAKRPRGLLRGTTRSWCVPSRCACSPGSASPKCIAPLSLIHI